MIGEISIDFRNRKPIYEQIVAWFEILIVNGVLDADSQLPSVRALAVELSINPNTIQRAYRELEQEGYVYTIPGRGSFVAGVPEMDGRRKNELLDSFDKTVKELLFLGMSPEELAERIRTASK